MSDRTTLKAFFETGDFPTQAQFADLIDSVLNLIDDDSDDLTESTTKKFLTTLSQTIVGQKDFSDRLQVNSQAHGGSSSQVFSAVTVFDSIKGNMFEMNVSGDVTIDITDSGNLGDMREGVYMYKLQVTVGTSPVIDILPNVGININGVLPVNSLQSITIITLTVWPSGQKIYTLTTIEP